MAACHCNALTDMCIGDLSHLFSILILLHKMKTSSVRPYVYRNHQPNRRVLTMSPERIRHLVQVAIPLSHRIHYSIHRYALLPREKHSSHTETLHTDLLWTDPFKSLWNTTFKLVFIGTSSYIIYLMLNDYKPTHDPNLDTFRVQYLVAGSAVLGILFPYKYIPSEVSSLKSTHLRGSRKLLIQNRCSGPSPSGWKLSPSFPSCSCFKEPARQRPSPHTTSSPWVHTEPCISPTGSTVGSPRVGSSPFRSSQVLFRLSCTPISSTSITPSTFPATDFLGGI